MKGIRKLGNFQIKNDQRHDHKIHDSRLDFGLKKKKKLKVHY